MATRAHSQTEKRGIWERCENSAFCQPRREWIQPSASQGESLQGKPTLPAPWSWTSSLQSCGDVGICWFSGPPVTFLSLQAGPRGRKRHIFLFEISAPGRPSSPAGSADGGGVLWVGTASRPARLRLRLRSPKGQRCQLQGPRFSLGKITTTLH